MAARGWIIVQLPVLLILLGAAMPSLNHFNGCSRSGITDQIDEIKHEKNIMQRTLLAEQLFVHLRAQNPDNVQGCDISRLIAMMSDKDDSVRMWIASCLRLFGQRAKSAIPALERAYAKIRCSKLEVTSAPEIYYTLKSLGEKPAPYVCR